MWSSGKRKLLSSINHFLFFLYPARRIVYSALLMVVMSIVLLSADSKSTYMGSSSSLFGMQPVMAQRVSVGDVWQKIYQQLPDFPKENSYTSKEGGIAENNTLVSRMIQYHVYAKGRAPNYRFDWKLTLADYLGINEPMYDNAYPGADSLRQNPLDSDRAAIKKLSRSQRDALVQALVNGFSRS